MIFNQNQINFLLKTLDTQIVFFIAKHIGIDSLTEEDLDLLKHRGIDINKLKLESSSNTLSQAYKFGILAKSLGDSRTKDMKYSEFLNFIQSGKFVPLNEREENTLNYLKHQTYHDIKGLGNKISKDLTTVHIEASQQQREKYEKLISEEAQKTVLNRESVKSMVSRLGELTQDWNRDFGRIAETVLHTAYEEGRAAALERTRGKEVLVYKDVFSGACFPTQDTEYLTKTGFKLLKDISMTDQILSFNKDTLKTEWAEIKQIGKYWYKGTMHNYKHSSLDLLSTPNHKHLVKIEKHINKKSDFSYLLTPSIELRKIPSRSFFLQTIPNWEGDDKESIIIGEKVFITKYFVSFMGWWLSEGHISIGEYNTAVLCISQTKSENREKIFNIFKLTFPDKNIYYTKDKICCSLLKQEEKELIAWFKNFGKSYEKFIPIEIKQLSVFYLNLFLQSYIAGDGHIEKSKITNIKGKDYLTLGKTSIKTSSYQMVKDLSEIILKLGKGVSSHERNDVGKIGVKKNGTKIITKRINWEINITQQYQTRNINKFFSEIYNWEGEVGCIELNKNYTLLIKRNGYCCWSGNCRFCIQHYLTDGIGSKPRIFKLSELRANGTNIGKKQAEWKAVLGAMHPFCRCTLYELPDGYVWDEEKKDFTPHPELYKRKVERKSKIKVTIGDKESEI